MTTALKIITRAFSKAGIRPAETPLTDAEIEDGLDVLNDMLSSWSSTETLTGVEQIEDVNDETLIPRYAEWAVKANLTIMLASEYQIPVTQGMAHDATYSKSEMVKARLNLLEIDYPPTLPIGSGNHVNWATDRDFFTPEESAKENF